MHGVSLVDSCSRVCRRARPGVTPTLPSRALLEDTDQTCDPVGLRADPDDARQWLEEGRRQPAEGHEAQQQEVHEIAAAKGFQHPPRARAGCDPEREVAGEERAERDPEGAKETDP